MHTVACEIEPKGWYMIDEIDLIALLADHADLARLCDTLETIADALPRLPEEEEATWLCRELEHRVPMHEAKERKLLGTVFTPQTNPNADAVRNRIQCRTASHVVQAQDLVAALQPNAQILPVTTLGYMLRCFFEGCRADMAFEELAILSICDNRLTRPARAQLRASLDARCRA